MTNWNQEQYSKAWNFATLAHAGQTYGGNSPNQQIDYINHIGSVAMEVIWTLSSSTEIYNGNLAVQCALLHDTIEDTKYTYKDLAELFGYEVANGVLALTKSDSFESKSEKMNDSLRRIKEQPYEIWMVKMADRITNLYDPPYYWDNNKILAYRDEARIIYDELHHANELLAGRLLQKITDYPLKLRV